MLPRFFVINFFTKPALKNRAKVILTSLNQILKTNHVLLIFATYATKIVATNFWVAQSLKYL